MKTPRDDNCLTGRSRPEPAGMVKVTVSACTVHVLESVPVEPSGGLSTGEEDAPGDEGHEGDLDRFLPLSRRASTSATRASASASATRALDSASAIRALLSASATAVRALASSMRARACSILMVSDETYGMFMFSQFCLSHIYYAVSVLRVAPNSHWFPLTAFSPANF